ncbi:MAG: DNA translocase FtsK [Oscillospiraceae bacterium]|nr:DNA translocase FtsK [Oscillospiraceae bacterium]
MEQKRKKSAAGRGRPPQKRPAAAGKKTKTKPKAANAAKNREKSEPGSIAQNIAPYILTALSIYILAAFFISGPESVGGVGVFTRNMFYGLFGAVSILVPILMMGIAVFLKRDIKSGFFKYRLIFSAICLILIASMFHLGWKESPEAGYSLSKIFDSGKMSKGGGVFGGYLAETLRRCVGTIGAWIFAVPLSAVFCTFLFGYTPMGLAKRVIALVGEYKENRPVQTEKLTRPPRSAAPPQQKNTAARPTAPAPAHGAFKPFEDDVPIDLVNSRKAGKNSKQNGFEMGDNPFASNFTEETEKIDSANAKKAEKTEKAENPIHFEDFPFEAEKSGEEECNAPESADFEIPENLEVGELENLDSAPQERDDEPDTINAEESADPENKEDQPLKKEYKFPPISYLNKDTSTVNSDIKEELQTTAQKLIETLASFGVKTKIYGFSRGPSITRYEISPDSGVKVNSVVNLANDISLNLAAEVRIEAPIPGKAAIGIEVPNKVREIVYLRSLIEEPQFSNAASKITIALGMDVAGKPIYSDIAKMPHLLIAGATNMGKSVCINSIITSILYKASPEEVKFIMVDPKKVELNIYNGIPHLLVPVVSDPKKAAGALSWAVNEMENRYKLIEEREVRDFKSYNESIKDDPLSEPLPQIVIIIDELADLMLTAPADVEQSVNRLAAKARAAGLHLIVGTQRPSVDVITGLIKANIPTRIAFTVVAPQDSRTIINMGGAEKLIGLGDMLYVPTGSKPIRVQGAYISDGDRVSVVDFWKAQSDGQYDEGIADEIEQEAAKTNTKGAKIKEKEDEIDPDDEFRKDSMLKSAIEVALDNGRISTSLLQTKLSLGYARAARIVDTMEKMGMVGPFEGSKPRKLLITKQQFIEMTMNSENFE